MNTKSFFGPQGLTSTSANYYANLAKEYCRRYLEYLGRVRFVSTSLKVIGDSQETKCSNGINSEELNGISLSIDVLAQMHSLIAFFREAIKEKERLSKEAENYLDQEVEAALDKRSLDLDQTRPVIPDVPTEESIMEEWSVGEQEKYLSLEAEASVLGKLIHEDGALSLARRELMERLSEPNEVTGNGRDTLIRSFTPSVSLAEVDSMYFDLQARHRKVQAELNGMKQKIKDRIESIAAKQRQDYDAAMKEYMTKRSALDDERRLCINRRNEKRAALLQEVQNLKIVVPNRLREVFNELQQHQED